MAQQFYYQYLKRCWGNAYSCKGNSALTAAGAAIATAVELGTAGTGTLYAGAFIIAWGAIVPTIAGAAVTYGINSLKGKTFAVDVSWVNGNYIASI